MDTFDEDDYATALGFKDANEAYMDIWNKSMEAQEYDALQDVVETVYGLQERTDRANTQGE
jgi:hypothetical protein